jgi:hypothetical protein
MNASLKQSGPGNILQLGQLLLHCSRLGQQLLH